MPAIRLVLLMLTVSVLFEAIYPLLYGKLTDALVAHDARLAIIMLCVLFAQSGIRQLIDYLRELYEIDHIDWELNLRIMNTSLERISGFSMSQCAGAHTGKTRDVVRNGRSSMKQLVFMAIYRVGPTFLRLVMALIALMWVSPAIGSVALGGSLIYLAFAVWLFVRYRAPLKALENRGNDNSKFFADTLANMEVVMAYARQRLTIADFDADGQELAVQGKSFWRKALGWFYIRNGVALLCRNLIMAFTAYLLFGGSFSFGVFVSLTQWAMQAVGATQDLGQMQRELSQHWAHMELYLQLLHQKPEIAVTEDALRVQKLRGHITFNDVTFAYQPRATDDPLEHAEPVVALDAVSFEILPGQKIALVGESGAGKSTIAYALMRARDPQSGTIRMDGTDLRDIDIDTLRRRIGYVPQHPRLFDRTLRYNLAFGLEYPEHVTDERLREVLSLVQLDKIAANGGLDSKLGEGGHSLSGGERQRLCIARALIKNPDVLIFDEATSSLDPVNEKKVQDAIDAVEGRTKIIIAHRYSTIRDVDRILVFDNGHLLDDGAHDELMERCTYYRALLEQQGLL
jgi:ATP-binding cassette subfamily B protein